MRLLLRILDHPWLSRAGNALSLAGIATTLYGVFKALERVDVLTALVLAVGIALIGAGIWLHLHERRQAPASAAGRRQRTIYEGGDEIEFVSEIAAQRYVEELERRQRIRRALRDPPQ